jgi:hypothetical protein
MRIAPCLGTLMAAALLAPSALAAPPAGKPVERRLHSENVEASSFLWNDWNRFQENYHPNYAMDDDPRTAWVEGASSSGKGEWLRIRTSELDGVSAVRLRLRNGYHKSKVLFGANARIKDVTVKLLPSGRTTRATLADTMDWQELTIAQEIGKLEAIELQVGSVYEGTKYADLCLSDVQVFATATDRQNPVYEKIKFSALQAWKQQRVAAANQFRTRAGEAMPLLPAYVVASKETEYDDSIWETCKSDQLCQIRQRIARASKLPEMAPWAPALALASSALDRPQAMFAAKVAPTDARPLPPVDGFRTPELWDNFEGGGWWSEVSWPLYGVLGALQAESLRVIESPSKVTIAAALDAKARGCNSRKGATYTWALRQKGEGADAGRDQLRVVLAVRCGRVESRDGTSDIAMPQLLVYDAKGHLSAIAGTEYVDGLTWASVEGRDVVVSARGMTAANVHSVDRRVVAAAP